MPKVFLSLGSNLADKYENITLALFLLSQKIKITKKSELCETEPYGKKDQPWFLNICCEIETQLNPQGLLQLCQEIERKLGRERKEKWGERTIDIDILLYGDRVIKTDTLTIPHAELHKRRFVLVPLAELSPDFMHPILKKSIQTLLNECQDHGIVRAAL